MAFPFCNLKHLIKVPYNKNILIMGVIIMKRKKTKVSNISLFKQYLLLFFIIAFIPVFISCTSFYFSYRALKNEVIHSNQASTRLIQQSLDSKIKELDKIIQIIKKDSTLTRYALKKSSFQAVERRPSATPSVSAKSFKTFRLRVLSAIISASNGARFFRRRVLRI